MSVLNFGHVYELNFSTSRKEVYTVVYINSEYIVCKSNSSSKKLLTFFRRQTPIPSTPSYETCRLVSNSPLAVWDWEDLAKVISYNYYPKSDNFENSPFGIILSGTKRIYIPRNASFVMTNSFGEKYIITPSTLFNFFFIITENEKSSNQLKTLLLFLNAINLIFWIELMSIHRKSLKLIINCLDIKVRVSVWKN